MKYYLPLREDFICIGDEADLPELPDFPDPDLTLEGDTSWSS